MIYAVGGAVAATVGCLLLRWVVSGFVSGSSRSRTLLIRAVTAFPFACLFWAGGVFIFSAAVNVVLLRRDVGIGDGFDCPCQTDMRSVLSIQMTLEPCTTPAVVQSGARFGKRGERRHGDATCRTLYPRGRRQPQDRAFRTGYRRSGLVVPAQYEDGRTNALQDS